MEGLLPLLFVYVCGCDPRIARDLYNHARDLYIVHLRARRTDANAHATTNSKQHESHANNNTYNNATKKVADPRLYAANVRRLMAAALGVPLVDEDRTISQALEKAGECDGGGGGSGGGVCAC